MRNIVIVVFWSCCFGALVKLVNLVIMPYPRTFSFARWEDGLTLALSIGAAVRVGWLLWS